MSLDTTASTSLTTSTAWRVYTEDWDPAYGAPTDFGIDDSEDVEQAEPGSGHVGPVASGPVPLAFIDGRRRAELTLWAENPMTGERVPGLAGAYAVGAVTIRPGSAATYAGIRVARLAIWGGGHSGDIVGRQGFTWRSRSVTDAEPDRLLADLQDQMRSAEGNLALDAADHGWYVVLDGPLNRVRSLHDLVTGYVKSHHRQILPSADHATVPSLVVGERTRIFTAGSDRYTCYVRVGNPGPGGSPWTGIARLDFPAHPGVKAIAERATLLASVLPTYAGVPHRDPRAPVNLTPVRNLETHLSRMLGRVEYATRAARDAVISGGPT